LNAAGNPVRFAQQGLDNLTQPVWPEDLFRRLRRLQPAGDAALGARLAAALPGAPLPQGAAMVGSAHFELGRGHPDLPAFAIAPSIGPYAAGNRPDGALALRCVKGLRQ
jgi:hypothetical protein